jgi:glycosyltransferase involved in cell wall biosynthesis
MRILIVSAYFDHHRGGIEIVAGRLAREFRRAGHTIAWLASAASTHTSASEREWLVPVPAFNGIEKVFGIPFPVPAPTSLRMIHKQVERADVVMLHDCLYPANVAAFLFARWLRKPVVVTQHIGNVPFRNPFLRGLMKSLTRVVTRPMLASADQVVFISNVTAKAFADIRYRRPPRLIFNGIDANVFHPATSEGERAAVRTQLGLPLDRPVALFVGRFVEKKGLHILQQAARLGGDVVWAFAGWGPLDPRQWALPNVRVYSRLGGTSLAPLYRASDAFVLPSTGEGFPLVVQEALACGLPVVCGAETAQADERLAGLLHPVAIDDRHWGRTASDVVQAVSAAITAHRRSPLANVADWYSWSRAGQLYLDLLNTISTQPAAPRRAAAGLMDVAAKAGE